MGNNLLTCCINKRFSDYESDRQVNKKNSITTTSQNSLPTLITNYSSEINKKIPKKTAKFLDLNKKYYLMEQDEIKSNKKIIKQKLRKLKLNNTKIFLEHDNTGDINLRINKIINKHFRVNPVVVRDKKP
jgi:hypothetical protein